ncbi:ribosome biogenesis GTPase YlqF [Desulfotomaculum copahuensis]|uniref:Ribosome biogenesis GTPase A n=1 Tax=Desulfotomaculum copahuensis TaxID=1838280 RepID=A0A1B7LB91_9FIRM|nr:ribosome biogenesis GTPase YlqF [Desulfotomaculum copahuensis]OAT79511.1 ribosome biogenesis GTPase YlqF [Desulfotomaculum copahuensis]
MDIQWYPGHMARAKRLVQENLKLVDVVIELLDARLPASSRNPLIDEVTRHKPRLVVLNKTDLADPAETARWLLWFNQQGMGALAVDAAHGRGVREVPAAVQRLAAARIAALAAAGRRPRPPRCMVLGIPNVGKSMLINALAGRAATRTANRPGVTRGQQWVRLARGVELLDTPGVLWPKFGDQEAAMKLAATGAIREEVYQPEEVAVWLAGWLRQRHPRVLPERYAMAENAGEPVLEQIAVKRGLLGPGGRPDVSRAAGHLLKEFREGKLGRITLDPPPGN